MANCFLDHLKQLVRDAGGLPEKTLDAKRLPVTLDVASVPSVAPSVTPSVPPSAPTHPPSAPPTRSHTGGEENNPADSRRAVDMSEEFAARHDADLLRRAWQTLTMDAPEDEATPLPSDFPEQLRFMEMSSAEASEEYATKYPSRLGPEVTDDPEVHRIMKEKGSRVFVPQSWEGIKGITFHINWKGDLPAMKKPRARPVNPKLFEHVKKEYERLAQYMYVPSDEHRRHPHRHCLSARGSGH